MNVPKRLCPHLYEYRERGGIASKDGSLYAMEHAKEIEREHFKIISIKLYRERMGGNKKIHLYEKNN